jgi:hydrogenase maturation protein HypF
VAAALTAMVGRIGALYPGHCFGQIESEDVKSNLRRAMAVASKSATKRLRITLRGAVQGVGFRTFVYHLVAEMSLTGWVLNSSAGLVVEVEGPTDQLTVFEQRLEGERPKASVITVHESAWIPAEGSTRFEIHASDAEQIRQRIAGPRDLRRLSQGTLRSEQPALSIPFTNCTNCGPRYTIVVDISYHRPNTTMRDFVLCAQCREEYESPGCTVILQSRIGGNRVVDMLSGEQLLPRIC